MKKKKNTEYNLKSIIIAILLVSLVLFYVNHLSNKSAKRRSVKQATELEQLMDYNMSLDYPDTPRDVVKLHNRYLMVFYTYSLSDEELMALNDKVRSLYCSELLAINPVENALPSLKKDIANVKEAGYAYKSYLLPEASQIVYFTKDGKDMATLDVTITVDVSKDTRGEMTIQYFLIKENELWKLYGWGGSKDPNIL